MRLALLSLLLLLPCGALGAAWAALPTQAAPDQTRANRPTCPPAEETHCFGLMRSAAIVPGLKPNSFHALPDRIYVAVARHERESALSPICPPSSRTLLSQHVLLRI